MANSFKNTWASSCIQIKLTITPETCWPSCRHFRTKRQRWQGKLNHVVPKLQFHKDRWKKWKKETRTVGGKTQAQRVLMLSLDQITKFMYHSVGPQGSLTKKQLYWIKINPDPGGCPTIIQMLAAFFSITPKFFNTP
jgi:hypothetical protein